MNSTERILVNISTIMTMLENFPNNLLDNVNGKTYTSAIEFVLDLLRSCGVNDKDILDFIISKIYGFEGKDGRINVLYEPLEIVNFTNIPQNSFIKFLEQTIKVLLMTMFTSLFTCSALPVLPNKVFDYDSLNASGETLMPLQVQAIVMESDENDREYKLKFPISLIDISNMLSISPTTSRGRLYYTLDGQDFFYEKTYNNETHIYEYVPYTGDKRPKNCKRYASVPSFVDESSTKYIVCYKGKDTPGLLYKTYDMNAFMWYVLNRGTKASQQEKNHLMWDSRISAKKNDEERKEASQWNAWYSSKTEEGKEFKNTEFLYPIIQLEPYMDSEILVRIPAQRYFAPKKREKIINGDYNPSMFIKYFNSSIYKFNWEYLQNIQILNPKLLLTRFVEHVLNLALSFQEYESIGIAKKQIQYKLSAAIKSIIEADDMDVEDCYNIFSNEDFDNLLNEMLLERYSATKYGGESNPARKVDTDDIAAMIDNISANATKAGNINSIKRMVNDIALDPVIEPSTEYSWDMKFDENFLQNLIWAMVMPMVESLFTPQVMLLVMINFDLMGVINLDESLGNNFGKLCNLIINQLLSFIKSIVITIKNKILEILIKFLSEKIIPILLNYKLLLYLEQLSNWFVILGNAVKCVQLNIFDVSGRDQIGYIEDVDYADIEKTESIPESQKEC